MDLQLSGRTALVTGAASGIGAATARELAREGARLVLVDLDKQGLADVGAEIEIETELDTRDGPRHVEVTADLATAEGVAAAMREALAATGGVDILVSNAGVCPWRTLAQLTDADWRATWEINFMGTVRAVTWLLPGMVRRGRGSIVITASDLARQPEAAPADYQVSKVSLVSYMKSLAMEAAPVRVNAVAPGPTWTALWQRPGGIADDLARRHGLPPAQAVDHELRLRQLPLGRIGQPAEIASVIAFLASDRASYVTGSVWGVDGGSIRGLF
jgi:NAD(P)-dependent dehydrogenase (short-subunit alcohol dehydrogenase family)